jgi:hypothetical protein
MSSRRRAVFLAVGLPLAVTAITLRSLAQPGFLVQIDTAFGLRTVPGDWSFYAPVRLLTELGQITIGGALTGRIVVSAALFMCGFSAMILLRDQPWWAQAPAGLLAMLNPFVYDRLVEGQWGVVIATAGLLLLVAAWLSMRRSPRPAAAVWLALSVLLTLAFSADFAGILLLLVVGLAFYAADWRNPVFRRWTLAAGAGAAGLSAYGVLAFFLSTSPASYQQVTHFGPADFSTFRSTPAPGFGVFPALAGLYGEWSERLGRYLVADMQYPWWVGSTTVLVALAMVGALLDLGLGWLIALGVIGLIASASTATGPGLNLVITAAQHIPILGVYREPQKWDVLWLLALVVLVPAGAVRGAGWLRKRIPQLGAAATALVAAGVAAAVLAPAGWTALTATSTVVSPVQYPASWYAAAAYMKANVPTAEAVAVLPWHLYETLPFIGRTTADPAPVFFPGNLVRSLDPELPGQRPQDPISAASQNGYDCSLADALRGAGIGRALVLEDAPDGAAAAATLGECGFREVFERDHQVAVFMAT